MLSVLVVYRIGWIVWGFQVRSIQLGKGREVGFRGEVLGLKGWIAGLNRREGDGHRGDDVEFVRHVAVNEHLFGRLSTVLSGRSHLGVDGEAVEFHIGLGLLINQKESDARVTECGQAAPRTRLLVEVRGDLSFEVGLGLEKTARFGDAKLGCLGLGGREKELGLHRAR